jgi:hypothetical protein
LRETTLYNMADGDFLDLQNQLGAMMGAEDVGNLPLVEQERIKKVINQSYRELYAPSDGSRPPWAVKAFGFDYAGSIDVVGQTTANSSAFSYTGNDLTPEMEGSMCFVGDVANRLAKVDPATQTGEFIGEASTNETTFKINHNSQRLPPEVIDVDGRPERVGWGVLSPMNGHDEEARYRSLLGYDFAPQTAFGHRRSVQINSNGDEYNFGDPMFFYIDSASLGYETVLSRRMVVYPLPSEPLSIRIRANILPTPLSADAERAILPADLVDDILLPVARAKLAMIDPRYNSQNVQFLVADAKEALQRLKSMGDAQKVRSRRIRLKVGY